MTNNIAEQTEKLVQPILEELSLDLVDIVYEKEGPNWFLRVYIDKDEGVDIEECGQVSERLSEELDEKDPIKGTYFLEVSSPGAERPLKKSQDFMDNIGKNVFVSLYEPISGEKEFTGILQSYRDNAILIEYKVKTKQQEVEIPLKKIAKARLAVTFD